MKTKEKLVLLGLLVSFSLFTLVGTASANPLKHELGCRRSSETVLQSHYNASYINSILQNARTSSSIDWSANMPQPGDQGQQGSCVAWSTGYNYKSYQEQVQHDWGLSKTHHLFSPAYIYNQIDDGQDDGAAIADALNLLVNQGCDTLDGMPYSDQDYTTQPTQAQRQRASYFPSLSWTPIFQGTPSVTAMKSALANGPIVAGTDVYWSAGWETSGNIAQSDVSGTSAGGHAIAIVGYDDSHQTDDGAGAFKFINSWGASWGNYGGYGWISYSYAQNNFFESEAMYDKPATDTYSLSGTVDNQNQQPLAGVAITFAKQGGTDSVPAAVTTGSSGQWSQSGFEEGTPYQLTPSSANYTFTPANQNFSYDSMQPEVINIQAGGGSQTTTIGVTAPTSGTSWQAGSTQTISWAYTGNPGSTVKLYLLQGGSLNSTIASSVSIGSNGAGSYAWTIPASLAAGSNYQVRVTSTSTTSCTGASNSFTVSAPAPTSSITVTYPKSGVSLSKGQYYLISWKYTGNPGHAVKIDLLKGGSLYQTITSSASIGSNGSGYYSWHISIFQNSGSNFQVRITSTGNPGITSISGYFSIGY
ncbi:MAG: Ser-Thr-rich GPI-anchored membrane family protein [Thermacetogeniaceae bacterium]